MPVRPGGSDDDHDDDDADEDRVDGVMKTVVLRPPARLPSRSLSRLAVLAAAVTLFASACTGDERSSRDTGAGPEPSSTTVNEPGDNPSDDPGDDYVGAYATALLDEPGSTYSEAQARCLASAVVDVVGGPSALDELGITVADIESGAGVPPGSEIGDDAAADFTHRVVQCGVGLGALFAAGIAATGLEVGADFADCIDAHAGQDRVEAVLASGESGDDVMIDIALACAHLLGS